MTLVEQNHYLTADSGEPVDHERYQYLVGRLIYLFHTRPDIAFAVSVVNQYMHNPREHHQEAVYKIFRYLKSCPRCGLLFYHHKYLKIEAYTDVDWVGSMDDHQSTSGYYSFVGGNLVTWCSKKQDVVTRSSAETEYQATAQGIYEILWLKWLLVEIRLFRSSPLFLFCDNKATINIANNL